MKNRFNDPETLQTIGQARIHKFLRQFADEGLPEGLRQLLPQIDRDKAPPDVDPAAALSLIAPHFDSLEHLPEGLRNILPILETLAAPANSRILDSAVAEHIPC